MSRAAFRKADLERAVQAALKAGLAVAAVEIRPDGTIRIVTALTDGSGREPNEWDRTCAAE